MSEAMLHVIGAGLAGLAAAVEATTGGAQVVVHEAAPQAGGRCRSFHDSILDRTIDNGSHLLMSANHALRAFADKVGGGDRLEVLPTAYPFLDLVTGDRWTLRPNDGRLPWWVLSGSRRVPGTRSLDYLALASLSRAPKTATVAERLGGNPLFARLLDPLSTAILNTEAEAASASLLGAVMMETLGRGGRACRPIIAPDGLSAALIDPALHWLKERGTTVFLTRRLDSLNHHDGRITGLRFQGEEVAVGRRDQVVLAVPPMAAARLLPSEVPPLAARPIVNAHFRVDDATQAPPLLGMVGGVAQWMFRRGDVISVTVSAAGAWVEVSSADLAARLWRDVARALDRPQAPLPPWRVIKERKATLAHSPMQEILRPGARTRYGNLWLAGDWTATGLPCTLEGAVRSGRLAGRSAMVPQGCV